jgi:cysteinyl-tRNA synthetase
LVSDADEGEDKLEKGAKKYGKTVWEVAKEYEESFFEDMDLLNILRPTVSCRATDHIKEQVNLIEQLIDKGYAYETEEAVYFEVSKFRGYGKLFGQDLSEKLVGVRDEVVTETNKKSPMDFALWFKTVGKFADHVMHWASPWGEGFPGWHIECSAMSMHYLGEQFEIHTGGEDHLPIHHPNEIAQSEAVTDKNPFAKFWFHSAFLTVDGKKMSKSLGNVYRVVDVVEKGFSPMALRYLYMTTHYRKTMNFTWEALQSAQNSLDRILDKAELFGKYKEWSYPSVSEAMKAKSAEFKAALEDDLNTAVALAVFYEALEVARTDEETMYVLDEFDKVLGFNLAEEGMLRYKRRVEGKNKHADLIAMREKYRAEKNWAEADKIRDKIEALGLVLVDKKTPS